MRDEREYMKKVRTLKCFEYKFGYGELEYFPYQLALGLSVRYLKCDGMGWMFRVYFGPLKFWFNLRERK